MMGASMAGTPLTAGSIASCAADVKPGAVKSVQGSKLTVTAAGGKVMVDKAHVIKTDIAADNGVIHVIDKVVMPK